MRIQKLVKDAMKIVKGAKRSTKKSVEIVYSSSNEPPTRDPSTSNIKREILDGDPMTQGTICIVIFHMHHFQIHSMRASPQWCRREKCNLVEIAAMQPHSRQSDMKLLVIARTSADKMLPSHRISISCSSMHRIPVVSTFLCCYILIHRFFSCASIFRSYKLNPNWFSPYSPFE